MEVLLWQITQKQRLERKIAPAAKRQFFASDIAVITYICIQVKENSLEHFTAEDAVIG